MKATYRRGPLPFLIAARAWCIAARAWCKAARWAGALVPANLYELVAEHTSPHTEVDEDFLAELLDEAIRRANWLPPGQRHLVDPARPVVDGCTLTWGTSVDTVLRPCGDGWEVAIYGSHHDRERAAELELQKWALVAGVRACQWVEVDRLPPPSRGNGDILASSFVLPCDDDDAAAEMEQ